MRFFLIFSFTSIAHASEPNSRQANEFDEAYEKMCFSMAEYVKDIAKKRDEGVKEKTIVKFLEVESKKTENPTIKKILKNSLGMVHHLYEADTSQADAFLGTFKRCMSERKIEKSNE